MAKNIPLQHVIAIGFYFLFQATAQADTACPTVPPIQYSLIAEPRYNPAKKPAEVVDREAVERNTKRLQSIREYSVITGTLSDEAVAGKKQASECLDHFLDEWAKKDALLGPAPLRQGQFERFWALAGISLNALKLTRSGHPLSEGSINWLSRIADQVRVEQDRHPTKNNLSLWAALGVGTTGVLAKRPDLWAWAHDRVHKFLSTIEADGVAPTELRRRQRATVYHFYAAQPLMAFERIARCYNEPLTPTEAQAFERFRGLLRQLQTGKASLAERAGSPQQRGRPPVWFRILDGQSSDSKLPDMRNARLGGSIKSLKLSTSC